MNIKCRSSATTQSFSYISFKNDSSLVGSCKHGEATLATSTSCFLLLRALPAKVVSSFFSLFAFFSPPSLPPRGGSSFTHHRSAVLDLLDDAEMLSPGNTPNCRYFNSIRIVAAVRQYHWKNLSGHSALPESSSLLSADFFRGLIKCRCFVQQIDALI